MPRIAPLFLIVIPSLLLAGLGPYFPAVVVLMALLIAVPANIGTHISIGVDGVQVRWLWWTRFYPFARVKSIRGHQNDQRHGFEIELKNGEKRPVLVSKGNDEEVAKLALKCDSIPTVFYILKSTWTQTKTKHIKPWALVCQTNNQQTTQTNNQQTTTTTTTTTNLTPQVGFSASTSSMSLSTYGTWP